MEHAADCGCSQHASTVQQTLSELDFERGIWNAAIYNEVDRVRSFIGLGKTMERDNFGYTALHYAARNGNEDICNLLINVGGADVNAVTNGGATPLHRAAMMGHLNIVELLIKAKANPLLQDEDGQTALHRAASNSHVSVTNYLIDLQPNLKIVKDKKDQIPFDVIPRNANDDFKFLLKP
ncbi:ankyrin repeat domain-containing protein 39 [Eupeodes corollae]|uniref:ankyrin repeat domain-containing protein 39 n=1 Tax=Eupeodes corollae TaxID=290404 RepID=UPI0024910E24|nr:ankyrin repeat domain-containing protein 39 [Eupeodes corollae]